ncbi:NAD(P)-binding protein [Westerdykella ornata]|uniref:NAD(P)-binding protein n=1 Tax=Westerdykella ornata TaxID=318751 RepID=A0A6A6JD73_WESOR|nr:NAD(P)-binding protein [Westerdykella ornata]KAF2273139.1 NAD(P)-binding protein [Westerdykella ornata]
MSTITTPSLPSTQKAVLYNIETKTLSLSTSHPVPAPSEKEHLIRVHSTAITNGELTWAPFCPDWPTEHVPCYDVSGTIVIPVPGSDLKPGDKVFGRVDAQREGTAQEYATILQSENARLPAGIGMLEAASVPMSAHTAWQALFEKGLLTGDFNRVPYVDETSGEIVGKELAKGKRVLILNAAGGVGLHAVQFGNLVGAWVVGTASKKNEEWLKGLGADEVVDYRNMSIKEYVAGDDAKKFDLVFDCVGGESMLDGWNGVKEEGGVYISVAPGFGEPQGGKPKGVRSEWFIMEARGKELEHIGKFITKGVLKTAVDSAYEMEGFEEAFARSASGRAKGKVVLRVGKDE